MADRFRLVTIGPDGRARRALELNSDVAGVYRERDTFTFTPAPRRERTVTGDRRYQGNRVIDTAHDNATAGVTLNVTGAGSIAVAASRVEALLERADRIAAAGDLYLEWRPEGLPRSVYMEVRGPATTAPTLRARAMAQAGFIPVVVTWPVAPLPEGLPCDVHERWAPPADKVGGIINYVLGGNGDVAGDGTYWTDNVSNALTVSGGRYVSAGTTPGVTRFPGFQAQGGGILGEDVIEAARAAGIPWSAAVDMEVITKPASATQALTLQIRWYRADGTFTDSVGNSLALTTVGPQRITCLNKLAPTDAVRGQLMAYTSVPNAGDTWDFRFDNIVLVQGATAPARADGNMDTFRWDGEPSLSRSVELEESIVADWTFDATGNMTVTYVESGPEPALRHADVNGRVLAAYTGRGYRHRDLATTLKWRMPDSFAATVRAGAGKTVPVDGRLYRALIYARLNRYSGGTAELTLQRQQHNTETTLVTTTVTAVPQAGDVVYVRCVIVGGYVRAEMWTTPPTLTGTPAFATAWTRFDAQYDVGGTAVLSEAGYPILVWDANDADLTSRVLAFDAEPYTFPASRAPHPFLLRDIPGNAPAMADVELETSAVANPFALLGWRSIGERANLAWNGEVNPDLDGWSNVVGGGISGAGATMTRVADSSATPAPDGNAFYVEVTSAAAANSGVYFRAWDRLRQGRVWTAEYWVWAPSGAWEAGLFTDNTFGDLPNLATPAAAATGWVKITRPVMTSAAGDRDRLELYFRHPAATAGDVLRIAGLRFYEGLPPGPRLPNQRNGRGAHPPFGLIHAEADDASARVGFAAVTAAGTVTGRRYSLTGTLTGVLEYLLDPALLDLPDQAVTGELEVEVYAMGALSSSLVTPRITASVRADDVTAPAAYTREYGSAGKLLVRPLTGTRDRAWRLGTITLPRDPAYNGRLRLRLDVALGVGSTNELAVEYLVLVARNARAGAPTGLVYDNAYPVVIPASSAPARKLIRHNLSGAVRSSTGTIARDTGLGGAPLELEPGDVELLAWAQEGAVPDDPQSSDLAANDPTIAVHVAVTPRYRLVRDA